MAKTYIYPFGCVIETFFIPISFPDDKSLIGSLPFHYKTGSSPLSGRLITTANISALLPPELFLTLHLLLYIDGNLVDIVVLNSASLISTD